MSLVHLGSLSPEFKEGLRRARLALLGVAMISAIINWLFLTGPLFMLEVYDRVLPSHSLPTLVALFGIVAALYVVQGLLDMVRSRILARAGAVISVSAAHSTFQATTSNALRAQSSEPARDPIRDLDQVGTFMSGPGPGVLFDLPWIPLYLLVCFSFHPWIGFAALSGAGVLLMLTVATDLASRRLVTSGAGHAAIRSAISEDGIRNAEVVRAMGMEQSLSKRWSDKHYAVVANRMSLSDVASAFGAASRSFRMFLQSGVLALGAYLVIDGQVTSGVIVASGIIVSRALAPVELSIANWRNFIAARQSWRRLSKALQSANRPDLMALPKPTKTLKVENLTLVVLAGERTILRDVAFTLEAGSAMAVIGPSAAGKSSLGRALVGLWSPARGSVRVDGAALGYWHSEALGRHIGYLPQDFELISGTIAENISRFEPGARSEDIIAAAKAADVHDMILRLPAGYDTAIGPAGHALSMGQRQRLGLARALYGEPFLVVLDEPNSNLDAEGEAALTRAINGVRERKGIAVVIAHRASALTACDMIMMISDGHVQLFGRKEELMQKVRPLPARQDLAALRPGATGELLGGMGEFAADAGP